jgi:4-hydroxybenzoate polyprenyltransferase
MWRRLKMLTHKLKNIFILMRIHKPIGILLLLWPTLWALWLAANGVPDYFILSVFITGVIVMRTAGCVINDIADRRFDALVTRTRARPLAAGTLSVKLALVVFSLLMLMALMLLLQLNRLTIYLGFAGALLVVIYPFLKRYTHLPQLGLGVAFSWCVPMAFAAVTETVPLAAWLLFCAAMLWPVIYDTMYALADRPDDLQIGVKSTAILFGKYDTLIIAGLQILFLLGFVCVGFAFHLLTPFYCSLAVSAALFIYQQMLIKKGQPLQAFSNNNWVGLIIFAGIAWSLLQ